MIEVVKFLSDPIGENAYLFFLEGEKRAVAVDPSYNAQAMLNYLKEEETQLEAILLTHGHFDHIAGVDVLREATSTPVYIHEADAQTLEDPEKNMSVITHRLLTIKPADRLLKGQEVLELAGMQVQVLHTPGHTQGGVCYLAEDVLFSGDTLFSMSIGRTDLPGSNEEQMKASLAKLCALEREYVVYPGHGQSTSLGFEVQNNPYLGDERWSV